MQLAVIPRNVASYLMRFQGIAAPSNYQVAPRRRICQPESRRGSGRQVVLRGRFVPIPVRLPRCPGYAKQTVTFFTAHNLFLDDHTIAHVWVKEVNNAVNLLNFSG